MKSGPALIVMAAGIGRRFGGLKQLEAVGPAGEFIIDYSVYDALRAGFQRIVFVIRPELEDAFRARVGGRVEGRCETLYVFQSLSDVPAGVAAMPTREKPWGTGHAVLSCRHVVDSPFVVINADDFYGRSTFRMLYEFLLRASAGARVQTYGMVGYRVENTLTDHGHVARGVCVVDAEQNLLRIDERFRVEQRDGVIWSSQDGESWVQVARGAVVSMNMWAFTPAVFDELEVRFGRFLMQPTERLERAEFYLPEAVGAMIAAGKAKVRVMPTEERWFGVTYRPDLESVRSAIRALVASGRYPADLWSSGA